MFCIGFAQAFIQILTECTGFFVNHSLLINTSPNYVAAWNIVQKNYTLMLMPIVVITQGVQTMIAYYVGHQKEKEKKITVKLTLLYTTVYGIFATLLISLLGYKILKIYGLSSEIYIISINVLKIIFFTFPLVGIFYTILTLLEVTGQEIKAVLLCLIRQLFAMIPLVYLLPQMFPYTKFAPFFSIPITDVLAIAIASILLKK